MKKPKGDVNNLECPSCGDQKHMLLDSISGDYRMPGGGGQLVGVDIDVLRCKKCGRIWNW